VRYRAGCPLQRNERPASGLSNVTVSKAISHEIGVTFRVLGIAAVAAYRFPASSLPLPPRGTGLRGVPAMTPGQESKLSDPSSRGLLLTTELDRRRPPEHAKRPGTSPGVPSPSALVRTGAASRAGDTILRLAGAYGFSPSHALHSAPIPSGLVSCRWRPWGCALQSLDLPRDPYPSRGRVPSCRFLLHSKSIPCWSPSHSGVRADWRRRRTRGSSTASVLADRRGRRGTLVFRGATTEAVELASPEGGAARVATCPGERGSVARSAPRTAARVPVEGRRAEVRRGSPRAAEPVALRPRDAVRCLAPRPGSARPLLLAKQDRKAPPDPALPSGPVLLRPKPSEGPSGGPTTATLFEWSVVGSRSGIRRTSRESRLQGIAPSGKPFLQLGVWPICKPVLSWAFASPGVSPPVPWGRFHDPAPRER
jgi:hypothetical protein